VNVYLDHAASTPIRPEVLTDMMPWLTDGFGNASSVHARGRRARHAVEQARESVARVLGVEPAQVIFTSGGTEANNQVIHSHVRGYPSGRLFLSRVEHDAVLAPAEQAERAGYSVRWLAPGEHGGAQLTEVPEPGDLVSIMAVNNETGACNALPAPGKYLLHSDAVQAAAWYDLRPLASRCSYLTLSGHKVGGPKGVGAVVTGRGADLHPLLRGGGQERDRRSGTENVAAIVGFARAMEMADEEREVASPRVRTLREALWATLYGALGGRVRRITPAPEHESAPHILHTIFLDANGRGLDGEMLILGLDMEGVEVSAGAACSSGSMKPSHVLMALGLPPDVARGAVRFSLGRHSSARDIEFAAECVARVAGRMS